MPSGLSGLAGEHTGQGMARVMLVAKCSTDCHSGANGQQLGQLGQPVGAVLIWRYKKRPRKSRADILCAVGKVWGIGGVPRNCSYSRRT
jgi:hypothetical protein